MDKEDTGYPSAIGKVVGALATGAIGWKAGLKAYEYLKLPEGDDFYQQLEDKVRGGDISPEEALAQMSDHEQAHQQLPDTPAEYLSPEGTDNAGLIFLPFAGAALAAWAGYHLGAKNPDKAVMIGFTTLAGLLAAHEIREYFDELNTKIDHQAHAAEHHDPANFEETDHLHSDGLHNDDEGLFS